MKLDIDYTMDDIAPLGRIGQVLLATDYNSETDLRRMLPAGVDLFTNRVMNANPLTIENLRAMSGDITRAASGILPGLGVDVMIYGCTSGTVAIGEAEIERLLQIAQPGIPCTNPVTAAKSALNAFGVKNISILTPYSDQVNQAVEACFSERGFNILNIGGFGLEDDIEMTGLPLSAIQEAALQICDPAADALFVSCTAIRAANVAEAIEQELGKPVVTSNQALVWHCLQLLGFAGHIDGFGRLFELQLSQTKPEERETGVGY